jgi:hypothetical protein
VIEVELLSRALPTQSTWVIQRREIPALSGERSTLSAATSTDDLHEELSKWAFVADHRHIAAAVCNTTAPSDAKIPQGTEPPKTMCYCRNRTGLSYGATTSTERDSPRSEAEVKAFRHRMHASSMDWRAAGGL